MKKRHLLLLMCLFSTHLQASAKMLDMNLSEAINKNMVKMEAVNTTGHYVGKTTKISIINTSESALHLKVDLGMILKPADSAYQPLVLAGEEMLVVQPSKSGEVEVNTFCGNSPRHCPAKELHYSFARIGSDTLIKVLRFIKTNSLFNYLGQDAVW